VSAIGTEAPSTHGEKHWTHRHPEWLKWRGERHHNAKLTVAAVISMRSFRKKGIAINAIAKAFGVHPKTARFAIVGVNWKHVRAYL